MKIYYDDPYQIKTSVLGYLCKILEFTIISDFPGQMRHKMRNLYIRNCSN